MTETGVWSGPAAPVPPMGPLLPQPGEPGWSVWPARVWRATPFAAAPVPALLAALGAGLIGAVVWRIGAVSIGYLVAGVAVFAAAFGTTRRPCAGEGVGIALTLSLLAVPAIRDAGWLSALCVVAAWGIGWMTLVGGRTWTSAAMAGWVVAWLPSRVLRWTRHGLTVRRTSDRSRRTVAVAAVSVGLIVVFGALFAGADAAFARLVDNVIPSFDVPDLPGRVFTFVATTGLALTSGYLLRYAPQFDKLAPNRRAPLRRWEWAVPLLVLDLLFATFVAIQLTVLFGGRERVLTTAGLTYAEYARQGFWQLLTVTALTLVVLAVALRLIDRESSADRNTARWLIGTLCLTSLVVVASAVHRMWTYEQAYGFTVERLLALAIELWLGAVFVMILAAGVRMSATWLPRAVIAAGAATLLGLATLNPDRFIADRNIDRYTDTGRIDIGYLKMLSADTVPALDQLPEPLRGCALRQVSHHLGDPDPWYEFNLSRTRAHHVVPPYKDGRDVRCPPSSDR